MADLQEFDATELTSDPPHEDQAEPHYRRGYHQGYYQGISDFIDFLEANKKKTWTIGELWCVFRQLEDFALTELFKWRLKDTDRLIVPPQFEFPRKRRSGNV